MFLCCADCKGKVKWSCYRPGVAQRVGRGIALFFYDRGTRRWVSGQQHATAALYLRERPGTYCTGGWVGPRAGLVGRKFSSLPEFDPGTSSPVAQSLYHLRYPAHVVQTVALSNCKPSPPIVRQDAGNNKRKE